MAVTGEVIKWGTLCTQLATKTNIPPGAQVVIGVATLMLQFCGAQLSTSGQEMAQIKDDVRRLVESAYKNGMDALNDATYAQDPARRNELIDQARTEFTHASNQDVPLEAAKAQLLVGACYYELGEMPNAIRWWEQSYASFSAIAAHYANQIDSRLFKALTLDGRLEYDKKRLAMSMVSLVSPAGLVTVPFALLNHKVTEEHLQVHEALEEVFSWMRPLSDLLHAWDSKLSGLRPASELVVSASGHSEEQKPS